jgi:hypothetical protein
MSHASASNGLSDIETHIENAPCNRPLKVEIQVSTKYYIIMDDPVLDVLLSFDEKASEVECE